MAIGVQSIQTTAWASASSVVVTKPVSLAVNDLMIGHIVTLDTVNGAPSGWTLLQSQVDGGSSTTNYIYYKIADSGDVAATNFTWTTSSGASITGNIWRITGHDLVTPIGDSAKDTASNTATPSFANTITPSARGNSLIIMAVVSSPNATDVTGYAIATSNPSWTEAYDSLGSSTSASAAYALRPQTTATGNSSAAGGDGSTDWSSIILAITEQLTITVSDTQTTTETFFGSLTLILSDTISVLDSISNTVSNVWTNVVKNISTWINQSKS